MSRTSKEIKQLDDWISHWEQIVAEFPTNELYHNALASLRQRRAEVANRIGRKTRDSGNNG